MVTGARDASGLGKTSHAEGTCVGAGGWSDISGHRGLDVSFTGASRSSDKPIGGWAVGLQARLWNSLAFPVCSLPFPSSTPHPAAWPFPSLLRLPTHLPFVYFRPP